MRSPWPRTPSAIAPSTALSLAGSIWCSSPTRFSNTVLTSVLTLRDRSTAPAASRLGLGFVRVDQVDVFRTERRGGLDFCLHVRRDVLDLIGVDLQLQTHRLDSRLSPPRPGRPATPRSLTLAPDSITRPARSEVSVTGTRERECSAEQCRTQRHETDQRDDQDQRPPRRVPECGSPLSCPPSRYPEKLRLPDWP